MNDSLQQALAQLIQRTVAGVDTSVDFLNAQLPDYIVQLLMWYGLYNFLIFSLCLGSLIIGVTVLIKFYPKTWNGRNVDFNEGYNVGYILVSLTTLMGVFVPSIVSINLVWLQIWIAPKVWLVEYAQSLIK